MMSFDCEVLIVGAGPAGAACAASLAPAHQVLLLDQPSQHSALNTVGAGETLPPAAQAILRELGLWPEFVAENYPEALVSRSVWGGDDMLSARGGAGWQLGRPRFDAWLRNMAQQRGAALMPRSTVRAARRLGGGWLVDVERDGETLRVTSRFIVDAGGRESTLAAQLTGQLAGQLGQLRPALGNLVCGWLYGIDDGCGGSQLHAEQGGWWYSSPLPQRGRMLAFYTDADLPQAASARGRDALLARLALVPALSRQLQRHAFVAQQQHGVCSMHGPAPRRGVGDDWMAVGDAALAFDPLSSQGLLNALHTGVQGACALRRHLGGAAGALHAYQAELVKLRRLYQADLDAWHGQEARWPEQPFWQRRHGADSEHAGIGCRQREARLA